MLKYQLSGSEKHSGVGKFSGKGGGGGLSCPRDSDRAYTAFKVACLLLVVKDECCTEQP